MHHRAFLTPKHRLHLWWIDHNTVTDRSLNACGIRIEHQIIVVATFFLSYMILFCLELVGLGEKKFGNVSLAHHLGLLDIFHFTDIKIIAVFTSINTHWRENWRSRLVIFVSFVEGWLDIGILRGVEAWIEGALFHSVGEVDGLAIGTCRHDWHLDAINVAM